MKYVYIMLMMLGMAPVRGAMARGAAGDAGSAKSVRDHQTVLLRTAGCGAALCACGCCMGSCYLAALPTTNLCLNVASLCSLLSSVCLGSYGHALMVKPESFVGARVAQAPHPVVLNAQSSYATPAVATPCSTKPLGATPASAGAPRQELVYVYNPDKSTCRSHEYVLLSIASE